jgi:hypothetical protein
MPIIEHSSGFRISGGDFREIYGGVKEFHGGVHFHTTYPTPFEQGESLQDCPGHLNSGTRYADGRAEFGGSVGHSPEDIDAGCIPDGTPKS